jgi:transcriptional regulator with XRE-family HTH domain
MPERKKTCQIIAQNVLRYRISRRLTQCELSAECGISQPRIAEIEAARRDPRLATIDRIAAALGVSPAALLTPLLPKK